MHDRTFRNTLLSHLDAETVQRLSLQPVYFELLHEMEFPGKPIEHLYFIESGAGSMTATFMDGAQVEVSLFGYESVIGVSGLMGTKRSLNRIYTQIEGNGFCCTLTAALHEFQLGGLFQALTLRYVQAQLLQAAQSAACNARHEMEQRLSRWLLICADRANTCTLKLSQEFLAQMLGCSRPTVSIIAGNLRGEGLIDYTRGSVTILDLEGLERRACECYRTIKSHLDNYAEFDTGFTV